MYKEFEKLNNVKSFIAMNNKYYCLSNKNELIINNEVLCDSFGIERSKNVVFSYKNMFDVETTLFYNDGQVEHFSFSLDSNSYNAKNTIIYNKDYNELEKQIGLYDFKNKTIKWFNNISRFGVNIRIINTLYYKESQITVTSLSLVTGSQN